jgi:hypothetical protein
MLPRNIRQSQKGRPALTNQQETAEQKPSDPQKERSAAQVNTDEFIAMGGSKPRSSLLNLTSDERRRLGARRPATRQP